MNLKILTYQNWKYSELNCVFKKTLGCQSKMHMKYKIKQDQLEKQVKDFEELSKYLQNPDLSKELNSSILGLKDFFSKNTEETQNIVNEESEKNENMNKINQSQTKN